MQEGRLAIGNDGREAGSSGGSPLKAATEICLNFCHIFSGFEDALNQLGGIFN
jgi:hypothetical protein